MNLKETINEQIKEFGVTKRELLAEIEKKELIIKQKDQDIENANNLLNIEINKQIQFTIYEKIIKEWIEKGQIKTDIPITFIQYIENIRDDLELVIKNNQFLLKDLLSLFQQYEDSLIEKMASLNTMNELKTQKSHPEFLKQLSKLKVTKFHFLNKIKINSENINIVLRLIHPFIEHKLSRLQKYKDKIIQNRNQKEQIQKILFDCEYLIRKILQN